MADGRRTPGRGTFARGPLLLLLALGSVVSLCADGRVSVRLVVDGAIAFAFVPAIQLAVFAAIYHRRARPLPFAEAVDRFFRTNAPWFVVIAALAVLCSVDTPDDIGKWVVGPRLWMAAAVASLAAIWSATLDVAFFRTAFERSSREAIVDALAFRVVAWPLALGYFLGFAIPPALVAWIRR